MSDNTSKSALSKVKHLPTILLGLIVAGIFLLAIFTFQVSETERAIVLAWGDIKGEPKEPGIHFRLPYPIQEVKKFDIRWNTFQGNAGQIEEMPTKNGMNVAIGTYVVYRIQDIATFAKAAKTVSDAEAYLNDQLRAKRNEVIALYNFDELINTDPSKMKLDDVKTEIYNRLRDDLMEKYGLEIKTVGIRSIGVPEQTAAAIASTMRTERIGMADKIRGQGDSEAKKIRSEADKESSRIISLAEASAKETRAEADAAMTDMLSVYSQAPELAKFLRELDAVKKIMSGKTTLILSTDSAPFSSVFNMKGGLLNDNKETSK